MTRCVGKLICDSPLSALESLSPLTTTMSLEASYIVFWKPNLYEKNESKRLVLLQMVSKGAINDIM